jgi:hypothetical protein
MEDIASFKRRQKEQEEQKELERIKKEAEEKKNTADIKDSNTATAGNEEETKIIESELEDEDGESELDSDSDEMKDDMTAFVENTTIYYEATTTKQRKTILISTGGTAINQQLFVTVTPRSMCNVFTIDSAHAVQTVDAGAQMYVDVIFDPTQFKEVSCCVSLLYELILLYFILGVLPDPYSSRAL